MATYRVSGMTCEGCVRAITNTIKKALPTAGVAVDLKGGTVTVTGVDDDAAIEKAVDTAGFEYQGRARVGGATADAGD